MIGEKEDKIIVYMTPEEAEKFKTFCEHYDSISTLLDSGALGLKNSSFTGEMNGQGRLLEVRVMTIHRRNH